MYNTWGFLEQFVMLQCLAGLAETRRELKAQGDVHPLYSGLSIVDLFNRMSLMPPCTLRFQ